MPLIYRFRSPRGAQNSELTFEQNASEMSRWADQAFARMGPSNNQSFVKNARTNSLDSLATSSNQSESPSDESHDSDSGAETKSKGSFAVKCEVYAQSSCGSIRSWAKSEASSKDGNLEASYEYVSSECSDGKKCDKRVVPSMETIPEESAEPKVSVKEILARFENLKEQNKSPKDVKVCSGGSNNNNNSCGVNNGETVSSNSSSISTSSSKEV